MESNLLKLDMLGHDDPTMIRMLQDLTGVDPQKIPLDDPETMSIFQSSKVLGYENDKILGPTGGTAIPEFGTSFVRGMLEDTQPNQFDILVRLSGFSHGTDVWLGNAKDLIAAGTCTISNVIGTMTPPVAVNIFSAVQVTRSVRELKIGEISKAEIPFFIGYVAVFFLCVFSETFCTFLIR